MWGYTSSATEREGSSGCEGLSIRWLASQSIRFGGSGIGIETEIPRRRRVVGFGWSAMPSFVPRRHWNPFYGVSFDLSVPVNLTNYVPKDETENLVGSRCANSIAHTWNVCVHYPGSHASSHPTGFLRKPVHRGEKRAASARHRVLY